MNEERTHAHSSAETPAATGVDQVLAIPEHQADRRQAWDIEVFFDGDCPLCSREIRWLKRQDKQDRILATDIAALGFQAEEYGLTQKELMAEIHGRLPSGEIIRGVEVFRRLYAAAGWRRTVAVTRLPLVRHALNLGYWLFAKNRLRMTGRCTTECRVPETK